MNISVIRLTLFFFTLLSFIACGDNAQEAQSDTLISSKNDSLKPAKLPVAIPLFLYLDKEGKIQDTLKVAPVPLSSLRAIGVAPTFPEGLASLQQITSDSILLICKFYNAGWPEFKITEGISPFTKENTSTVFAFTAIVDGDDFYASDCDNQLLRFLKYRSTIMTMPVKIKNTPVRDGTGPSREFHWQNKIPVRIYENDSVYETAFDKWKEYWDCGGKADYDPRYPEINLQSVGLLKKSASFSADNPSERRFNRYAYYPEFVFALVALNEKVSSVADSLRGKAQKSELTTIEGKKISGTGIDLNGDKNIDAFWFSEEYGDKKGSFAKLEALNFAWVQRLYLKIENVWTPVWYMHFDL